MLELILRLGVDKMEFKREQSLLNKLIIVDGTGKCGKSILLNILSCFEGVEKPEFNSFLEYIALAYHHKKISSDIAKAILQTEMDTELYNNMIGRYINTRLTDDTSVYKYHSPAKYLKRSLEEDGPGTYKKVLAEKPIYICWAHDLINKSDIIFEAYGYKLEWIYLNRNPIDIIYEWNKQYYSQRMAQDPTEMQYNVKYKNTTVPEIAIGWEEEFLVINPIERTIKMIYTYFLRNLDALQKKQTYKNLHVINFENLVVNPHAEIENLKNTMGREILPVIDQVLLNMQCPRILNKQTWVKRKEEIIKSIPNYYANLLAEIEVMYESIKNLQLIKRDRVEAPV